MPRKPVTPRDHESAFHIHELFFSTTDGRGVITFGNDVFARVSGYTMRELVGSPHNIIRHPDIPAGVFQMFWEFLLGGRSVAAYVKNMAADGSYYWVLAMVAPIRDGFLSIRLKPSGPLFAAVQGVYREMLQIEETVVAGGGDRKQAMAASRQRLSEVLASLGYGGYEQLMEEMLLSEVSSRKGAIGEVQVAARRGGSGGGCEGLRAEVAVLLNQLDSFLSLEKALGEKVAYVRRLGQALQLLSLNAQVRAAALEAEGRALQVVAEQMSRSAADIARSTQQVCEEMKQVNRILKRAAAAIATSDLSVEMMGDFLDELARGGSQAAGTSAQDRIAQLAEVVWSTLTATCNAAAEVQSHICELERRLEEFIKAIRTLEILHVTGKVECVRCREGSGVSAIFHDVHARTSDAREKLSSLVGLIGQARIRVPDPAVIEKALRACVAA